MPSSSPIETILTDLGTRLASRGVDAGMDALAETRVGQTPTGRVALAAVDALIDEYADDAIEAILRRIHARQEARVDERGAKAIGAIEAARRDRLAELLTKDEERQ